MLNRDSATNSHGPSTLWLSKISHPWLEVLPGPVIVLRYRPGHTYSDTCSAFEAVESLSEQALSPYAFITDLSDLTRSDAKGRARAMAGEQRISKMPSVDVYCKGVAWVVRTKLHQGVLTAITWFVSRSYATRVTQSFPNALAWSSEQLHSAQARLPLRSPLSTDNKSQGSARDSHIG